MSRKPSSHQRLYYPRTCTQAEVLDWYPFVWLVALILSEPEASMLPSIELTGEA